MKIKLKRGDTVRVVGSRGAAKIGANTVTIREDRFNDKTWMLLPTGWILTHSSNPEKPEKLNSDDASRVTISCSRSMIPNEVFCDVSNNSDYTLSILSVEFKSKDRIVQSPGGEFWTTACKADLKGSVEPHTMGTMSVKPPCAHDLGSNNWSSSIVAAFGSH